ncbi:GNAT family N-acetyltransferase [Xenorhabdus szentirmaii]|uniref:GNAT family N-acetyltransferase n=1 Tax=Xenorhabdus szentirmaii TaxID=290112 RepID=UPI0032B7187B
MKIVRLDKKQHIRSHFDCGEPALNNYLKAISGQHDKKDLSRTFVLVSSQNESQIKGFYSLALCTVELNELPENISKKYLSSLHCALIGRLAVSKQFQQQRLGEILLIDAIRKAIESSKSIPTPMIIVDAKNDVAKKFYINVGFQEFPQLSGRLFMPMAVAIEMLKEIDGM